MNITISKSKLSGHIAAPPSKSYAHRELICGALAGCGTAVKGISQSEDMLATLDCINALGIEYRKDGETVVFGGPTENPDKQSGSAGEEGKAETAGETRGSENLPAFPCRESGSTLRFFMPLALVLTGGGIFTGAQRLIQRGIGVYEDIFSGQGISLEKYKDRFVIRGHLNAGGYKVPGGISSQFITGLFFALPLLDGDSRLEILPPVESRSYIDITIDAMRQFGVIIEETEKNHFFIKGNQKYHLDKEENGKSLHRSVPDSGGRSSDVADEGPACYDEKVPEGQNERREKEQDSGSCGGREICVEGDWSNAAFLFALNELGHDLDITGLKEDSVQGDKVCLAYFEKLRHFDDSQPPIDLSDCPDLGPVLFAVAAAGRGGRFTGIKRLRIKESDRAAVMQEELLKFGISCELLENEMTVFPGRLCSPEAVLSGHNDHRIVMSLAVIATLTGGTIQGCEAVRKSYPDFFDEMGRLGMKFEKDQGKADT